jgi:hypothetical protein
MMARYKQWRIGDGAGGKIYPQSLRTNARSQSYNIKGKVLSKYLQYERQGAGRGINLGWTDNDSKQTATARAKWHFVRTFDQTTPRAKPMRYGEKFALAWDFGSLGWGSKNKPFVKYASRTVGINLNWSKEPSYEWTILGGEPGTEVERGDWVVIYNLNHEQPLMYFNRTLGGNIGWPDSSRFGPKPVRKKSNMANIVKPLLMR